MSKTSTTWVVRVEFAGPPTADQERLAEELLERLELDVVSSTPGRIGTSVHVDDSDTWQQAAKAVLDPLGAALGRDWRPVDVRVLTDAELDDELAQPVIPPLVGLSEAAELVGVTKQRIASMVAAGRFPPAIVQLASGPVFLESAVKAFAAIPRRGGRPGAHIA